MNTLQRRLDRLEQSTDVNRPTFCILQIPIGATPDEIHCAIVRNLGREPLAGDYILTIGGLETKDELRVKGLWPVVGQFKNG